MKPHAIATVIVCAMAASPAPDRTLKDGGKVGLWTKADSVIEFDDFTVEGR